LGNAPGRPAIDLSASVAGAIAALVTTALIYLGSRRLRTFDAALIGYATATIFLAFGVAYRYVMWVRNPPAMRYLRRGWQSFLSFRNFRRFPTLVPRALVSNLALKTFISRRGRGRWLAHQSLFWGVVVATLITFPLTYGWISFEAAGSGSRYAIVVWGLETITFDPVAWFGWLIFHALDIAALLVLLGCGYFLWRRFRDREATTGQRLGYDFLPLIALVAISVTGLASTVRPRWTVRATARRSSSLRRRWCSPGLHPVRQVLPCDPASGQWGEVLGGRARNGGIFAAPVRGAPRVRRLRPRSRGHDG
jgi:hypothetical protein